ncbi:hypothetical protein [Nocardia concava]|nr:hypothetical protein [Nocardia concava]
MPSGIGNFAPIALGILRDRPPELLRLMNAEAAHRNSVCGFERRSGLD